MRVVLPTASFTSLRSHEPPVRPCPHPYSLLSHTRFRVKERKRALRSPALSPTYQCHGLSSLIIFALRCPHARQDTYAVSRGPFLVDTYIRSLSGRAPPPEPVFDFRARRARAPSPATRTLTSSSAGRKAGKDDLSGNIVNERVLLRARRRVKRGFFGERAVTRREAAGLGLARELC